jgi:hypothetical protein
MDSHRPGVRNTTAAGFSDRLPIQLACATGPEYSSRTGTIFRTGKSGDRLIVTLPPVPAPAGENPENPMGSDHHGTPRIAPKILDRNGFPCGQC